MAKKKTSTTKPATLKVVKTPEDHPASNEPESNKANGGDVHEVQLPTGEEVLAAEKDVVEEVTRGQLVKFASKINILTKGKWFTIARFQKLFKMPKPQSAQILLALFAEKLIAIDQRAGVNKYKIDFGKTTQLEIIDKTINRHKNSMVALMKESKSLMLEIEQDKKAAVKAKKEEKKTK